MGPRLPTVSKMLFKWFELRAKALTLRTIFQTLKLNMYCVKEPMQICGHKGDRAGKLPPA